MDEQEEPERRRGRGEGLRTVDEDLVCPLSVIASLDEGRARRDATRCGDATGGLGLPKVERVLVADGECFTVEFAVRTNGASPAAEFMRDLREGEAGEGREANSAADEQVDTWAWFLEACARIANKGDPPPGRTYNQLERGIWELKHRSARLTFFDTDGSGVDDPTIDYDSYAGFHRLRPWPDDFDEYLRLTTGFMKRSQKTPPREINFAGLVRKEDLRHDRT